VQTLAEARDEVSSWAKGWRLRAASVSRIYPGGSDLSHRVQPGRSCPFRSSSWILVRDAPSPEATGLVDGSECTNKLSSGCEEGQFPSESRLWMPKLGLGEGGNAAGSTKPGFPLVQTNSAPPANPGKGLQIGYLLPLAGGMVRTEPPLDERGRIFPGRAADHVYIVAATALLGDFSPLMVGWTGFGRCS
jgi:hypothetical protein